MVGGAKTQRPRRDQRLARVLTLADGFAEATVIDWLSCEDVVDIRSPDGNAALIVAVASSAVVATASVMRPFAGRLSGTWSWFGRYRPAASISGGSPFESNS